MGAYKGGRFANRLQKTPLTEFGHFEKVIRHLLAITLALPNSICLSNRPANKRDARFPQLVIRI